MAKSKFITTISFVLLALLRGTTPLMAYLAVSNLDSTGLVVAWKSGISLVFFTIMLVTFYFNDGEMRLQIYDNLISRSTYWKLPLIGLMQAAAPYLLIVYSLQYLPPTLIGVFMAATPWFTIILERLPFVKVWRIAFIRVQQPVFEFLIKGMGAVLKLAFSKHCRIITLNHGLTID